MAHLLRLRLGTRGSALARWQAQWVADRLRALNVEVELVPISTRGDQQQTGPIGAIGVEGAFTKELQRALLAQEIDLAVHSLKDLPTEPVAGLVLSAVPPRGPVADVLISRSGAKFVDLPAGATLGTGSLRRRAQLWHARRDVNMADIRGNVDTRIKKLRDGQYDAIVLAEAGLRRLNLAEGISEFLSTDLMLPAVGQGALGIETRSDDRETRGILAPLDDLASHAAVAAERTMLARLSGGCLAPVAGWARLHDPARLRLTAVVLSADGQTRLHAEATRPLIDAASLGAFVADELLSQGAADLIRASRDQS
jgi:hydroxymethylbilane synthase